MLGIFKKENQVRAYLHLDLFHIFFRYSTAVDGLPKDVTYKVDGSYLDAGRKSDYLSAITSI